MAEKTKDLYGMLGVEPKATKQEIKKSYRKLAAKYHPDVSKEKDAEKIFKQIAEAYDVLMDDESRKEYDAFVAAMQNDKGTFDDVFKSFHSEQPRAFAPVNGETVTIPVEFYVSEVKQQVKKVVAFDQFVNCNTCAGHGFVAETRHVCSHCNGDSYVLNEKDTPFGTICAEDRCPFCDGTGYEKRETCDSCKGRGKKKKAVKIAFQMPKGVTEGFCYTIKGRGDEGLNGGKSGDLILKFYQYQDDTFEIENDYDLRMKLDVPFLTSLTGGSVKVEMPNGKESRIPIAKGTQSGHYIILPNEGLFNPGNGFTGNVNAVVNILVPEKLEDTKMKKIIDILK